MYRGSSCTVDPVYVDLYMFGITFLFWDLFTPTSTLALDRSNFLIQSFVYLTVPFISVRVSSFEQLRTTLTKKGRRIFTVVDTPVLKRHRRRQEIGVKRACPCFSIWLSLRRFNFIPCSFPPFSLLSRFLPSANSPSPVLHFASRLLRSRSVQTLSLPRSRPA